MSFRRAMFCWIWRRSGPSTDVFAVENGGDAGDLVVVQLLGLALRIDAGLLAQLQGRGRPDAVDVAQRNMRRLIVGQVNTKDTGHGALSLNLDAVCDADCCR